MSILKKLTKISLASLLCLMTIISTGNGSILAAVDLGSGNFYEEFYSDWWYDQSTTDKWGNGGKMTYDGHVVFCIEPGHTAEDGSYENVSLSSLGLTRKEFNRLAAIAYYGYYSNPTKTNLMLTQNVIWHELGDTQTVVSNQYPNWNAMKSWRNNVVDKADALFKEPSFGGSYEVDTGETLEIKDKNSVLKNYKVTSVTGGKATISGNTLKVTPDGTKNKMTVKVAHKDGAKIADSKSYFTIRKKGTDAWGRTYQAISPLKAQADPTPKSLDIKVNLNGNLKLKKVDEDGKAVPDTSFKVSQNSDMSNPKGTYTTGKDGTVTVKDLKPGTWYVQETEVPEHLVLDNTIHKVTVEANETASFTATNLWKKGKAIILKKDKETGKPLANAVFAVLDNSGNEVKRITTGTDGRADTGYLRFGDHFVQEVIAPNGYVLDDTKYPITITSNEQTLEITATNARTRGQISLSKEDSVTGKQPQGEATLKGAVYELRAKENITDPADGSVIYKKGALVDTLTTNSDGNASTDDQLYLGKYTLQETKASEGYTLDPTVYDVTLTYENQNVELITKSVTSKERVKAQAFEIIKISDNGNGEANLLAGAEFTIKAQKDIEKYGSWEAAPVAKNAQGKEAAKLVTDSKGHARSDELPYATYVVRETKTPADHHTVPDFTVTISEDSREPQVWRVLNDEKFRAIVKIVKEDAETGKTIAIPGAAFKIRDLETDKYVGYWEYFPQAHYVDTWETTEDGTVMTGDVLDPGEYQLEEIKAPNGYVLNTTPVKFRVTNEGAYEIGPDGDTPIITVKMQDTSVKGRISVEKRGEVLTGVTIDKNGNLSFVYEERGLPGAVFEIYAAEDILSADNQGDLIYKKDTLVQTLITGSDGTITSSNLPLAKYYVIEKTAPDGMVINKERKEVELTYEDQETEIVYSELQTFKNERQKVAIEVMKKDKDTGTALAGAEFTLYAAEDIYSYDDELLVHAGEKIEAAVSGEDGKASFVADMPLTKYEIRETKAPIGYASTTQAEAVDATYKGQDTDVQKYTYEFLNEITKVEVSKKDITNNEEIEGAHLMVYPKDEPGTIFESWISGQDGKNEDGTFKPHMIKGLEPGKTYVLHEVSSPYGFALADDIEFTVSDTGEVQKVEMKDEPVFGQLIWNKTGEIFMQTVTGQTEFGKTESPVWEESNLLASEITIYAAENITIGNHTYFHEGDEVAKLESDWDAVKSPKLYAGYYYYQETKVPHGYVADTERHYFRVEDSQSTELQEITSTLNNERPTVNIDMTKVLEEQKIFQNKDAYKDIVFGIFAREDIYNYMGEVAIENGTMIYTSGINEDGKLTLADTFDLPNGVYYLKELSTNGQYILNDQEYDFEIAYHGENVSEYTVQIGNDGVIDNELARGSIQVKKVDALDPQLKLEGVGFDISANSDMSDVIMTVETDENSMAQFNDLELGTYFIREHEQQDGYVLNDTIYEVEVKQDGDLLMIECVNTPTTTLIEKVDEDGKTLIGASLQVIDADGNVIDEFISSEEAHEIKYLVEGAEYTLHETKAPYSYALTDDIKFTVKDGQTITMTDEKIRSYVDVMKVDYYDNTAILKEAEFTMYADEACTHAIRTEKTDPATGIARFDDLTYGVIYIKETKAPAGYSLSNEVVKVEINDEWVSGDKDTRVIVYPDKPLPTTGEVKTGNDNMAAAWLFTAMIAGGAVLFITKRRKITKE